MESEILFTTMEKRRDHIVINERKISEIKINKIINGLKEEYNETKRIRGSAHSIAKYELRIYGSKEVVLKKLLKLMEKNNETSDQNQCERI